MRKIIKAHNKWWLFEKIQRFAENHIVKDIKINFKKRKKGQNKSNFKYPYCHSKGEWEAVLR